MTFRGDAHRMYLKLRSMNEKGESLRHMKELGEIQEVRTFYNSIDTHTLKLIYYRMIKEKNGSGIVPIFVTSVPWFFFLFSKQLQELLFHEGSILWLFFCLFYLGTLILSVIVHFREKAWAVLHIEIIQDIIADRTEQHSSTPGER